MDVVKSKSVQNIKVIFAEMSALNSEIEQFSKQLKKFTTLAT